MVAEAVPSTGRVKTLLARAFPGIRFTSENRTQAEQDDLVRRGVTRSRNSQHVNKTGLDVVLPDGVTTAAVRTVLADNGIQPGEFINESGRGRNQGTGAHLHLGLAPRGGAPNTPARPAAQSTYDRVRAAQPDQGPSISRVYDAYRAGRMEPQEAAQFERDVEDGHVMLPRGGTLKRQPAVFALPAPVIAAYNSRTMSDEDRAQIDRDLHDGVVSLPRGVRLQAPAPRTAGEGFGLGVRELATGVAGLGDLAAGTLNGIVNALPGEQGLSTSPLRDIANRGADALGLPVPESDTEKLLAGIVEGGAQGIATAGMAAPLAAVAGTTGAVARGIASAPLIDAVSGATSGASSEVARQAGAGPVGQLAAGLIGGGIPALAHPVITARIGRNAGRAMPRESGARETARRARW